MTTDSADLMSVAFGALLLISSLFGTVLVSLVTNIMRPVVYENPGTAHHREERGTSTSRTLEQAIGEEGEMPLRGRVIHRAGRAAAALVRVAAHPHIRLKCLFSLIQIILTTVTRKGTPTRAQNKMAHLSVGHVGDLLAASVVFSGHGDRTPRGGWRTLGNGTHLNEHIFWED